MSAAIRPPDQVVCKETPALRDFRNFMWVMIRRTGDDRDLRCLSALAEDALAEAQQPSEELIRLRKMEAKARQFLVYPPPVAAPEASAVKAVEIILAAGGEEWGKPLQWKLQSRMPRHL